MAVVEKEEEEEERRRSRGALRRSFESSLINKGKLRGRERFESSINRSTSLAAAAAKSSRRWARVLAASAASS